jgi:hypothetical protein
MPQPFDTATLHDATLMYFDLAWESGEVTFHLRTANHPRVELRVVDVTALTATRQFEWGPSASVNTVTISTDMVVLEMQSGDVLTVTGRCNAGAEMGE